MAVGTTIWGTTAWGSECIPCGMRAARWQETVPLTIVCYREHADNLIEEEEYIEDADAYVNGGMDVDADGPVSAERQNQLDSTDYHHGGNNIVASGEVDAQQAAARELNTVKGIKSKRIANDKRTTTPYMTKYERARVLGTRALQIRWVQAG